jgi:hypothetical protein
MMQDNIWGNRDREKGENNRTNPRNLMQDNPRLHHLEQLEHLDSPLSHGFKENTLLLIIIVSPKQT